VGSDQGGRARSIIHQTELSGLNIRGETQRRAQTAGHELEAVIAAAAAEQKTRAAIGRIRIRRHDGHPPYTMTVAPLGTGLSVYGAPWP